MAMSLSGLSSPSLSSAGLPEWPIGLSTPEAGAPRLVQKLVVRVKGKGSEALIVLYMRLAVSKSSITQTVLLFPDEGINLKSSQVYPVNMEKGGKTVIPSDANRHLQRAAEILALNRTSATASPFKEEGNGVPSESTSRSKKRAKITTSNFHVSLVVPPDADSNLNEERSNFIAIVHLSVPFTLTPPEWPYTVRIPLPRCLNNFLSFSVDESCVQENTIVEVDPPLLPKPSPMGSLKRRISNDIITEEVKSEADDDQTLSGPFYSTSSLCIRWATADAGIGKESPEVSSGGHRPIQAQALDIDAHFTQLKRISDNNAEIHLQASLTLRGVHYPGLDSTANLNLCLEAPSGAKWVSESVLLLPSTDSAKSLHSYSATRSLGSSMHSIKPGITNRSKEGALLSSDGSSDGHVDLDTTLSEEGNLLDVRPPKGITSSDFDLSSESDYEELENSTLEVTSSRKRRHSLASRTTPTRPPNLSSARGQSSPESVVYVVLNVAPFTQGKREFRCSLDAIIKLPIRQGTEDLVGVTLPLIKAQGIALQYKASGASCQVVHHGSDVKLIDRDTELQYMITLPESTSLLQMQQVGVDVLAESEAHKEEEALGDVSNTTTAVPLDPSSSPSEESLEHFTNRSFAVKEDEERGSPQSSQVESLSGMIQEVSVEVHSTATLQDDLLMTRDTPQKIKTTHVIRSSWPSTPAPSSSASCGSLLPRMVFALPCSEEEELQVLHASINGFCVHIEEATGNSKTAYSRIIDLPLPDSLKQAEKVDVSLLYTQEFFQRSSLCVFPPVASSVAKLNIDFHHAAFHCQEAAFTFTNQPMSYFEYSDQGQQRKQLKAHMLPSMTSISAGLTIDALPAVPISIAHLEKGPLRRTNGVKESTSHHSKLHQRASILHFMCTVLLAIAFVSTLFNMEPIVGSLSRKVDSLAMALDVDFNEGTWKPEPSDPLKKIDSTLFTLHEPKRKAEESKVRQAAKIEEDERRNEPNELSTNTTPFQSLIQSLSLDFSRTLSWPFRFFYSLFSRSTP